jgi:hypothetical protein
LGRNRDDSEWRLGRISAQSPGPSAAERAGGSTGAAEATLHRLCIGFRLQSTAQEQSVIIFGCIVCLLVIVAAKAAIQ